MASLELSGGRQLGFNVLRHGFNKSSVGCRSTNSPVVHSVFIPFALRSGEIRNGVNCTKQGLPPRNVQSDRDCRSRNQVAHEVAMRAIAKGRVHDSERRVVITTNHPPQHVHTPLYAKRRCLTFSKSSTRRFISPLAR